MPLGSNPSSTTKDACGKRAVLHLLQICLVYINTLLVQKVLSEKEWLTKMQPEDFRGLTPLFYGHITPYGEFQLDMNKRIQIEETG